MEEDKLSGNPDRLCDYFPDRYAENCRNELLAFLAHVQEGSTMLVNTVDGLRAASLADAAMQSMTSNSSIGLKT